MKTEFTAMLGDPNQESRQQIHRRKMYLTCRLFLTLTHRTFLLAAVLIGGTFLFQASENHHRKEDRQLSVKQSAHFCYSILTTVGFGEIVPETDFGKVFTMAYALIGIPIMLFALGAYGTFMNHCIRKMMMGCEFCCCKCWKGKRMYLKTLIILLILLSAEIFCFALYIKWLKNYSYLDSVYVWIVTITTIGFGDLNPYPLDESLPEALGFFGIKFFCLVTFAAIYQAVQGMIESINNNRRSWCAIIFCCYNNDKKDEYDIREDYHSPHKYSEYQT